MGRPPEVFARPVLGGHLRARPCAIPADHGHLGSGSWTTGCGRGSGSWATVAGRRATFRGSSGLPVELGVVEQRYRAVLEVLEEGTRVTEVAEVLWGSFAGRSGRAFLRFGALLAE